MSDDLLDAVKQWLAKASADWTSVEILTSDSRCPRNAVCFHCQQYVEKILKAFLTLRGIESPRTHDLRRLIQLAQPGLPALTGLADAADELSLHGVESRYPDDWREISEADMQRMLDLVDRFAAVLLPILPRIEDPGEQHE